MLEGMAHYFDSGTPSNDIFQPIENGLVRCRLYSLHRSFAREVFQCLEDMRDGVNTVDAHLEKYGSLIISQAEKWRRRKQRDLADERDYCLLHQLRSVRLPRSRPEIIMLDSGAFTAWNIDEEQDIDQLITAYIKALGLIDGKSETLLANLDVITNLDDTLLVKQAAMDKSDQNFGRLNAVFPTKVIPIIHQGEPPERIEQVARQAEGVGVIGISPNNDVPEKERVAWTKQIMPQVSHLRVHGYATTGNDMLNVPGLWSADSFSAGMHAKSFGQLDLCEPISGDPPANFNFMPKRYVKAQVGREKCEFDMVRGCILAKRKDHLDLASDEKRRFTELSLRRHPHFPLALLQYEMRARAIVNSLEIAHYAATRGQS